MLNNKKIRKRIKRIKINSKYINKKRNRDLNIYYKILLLNGVSINHLIISMF